MNVSHDCLRELERAGGVAEEITRVRKSKGNKQGWRECCGNSNGRTHVLFFFSFNQFELVKPILLDQI
jgi:hypothetical protein